MYLSGSPSMDTIYFSENEGCEMRIFAMNNIAADSVKMRGARSSYPLRPAEQRFQ